MPSLLRVVESVSHDPWFNLALEEWLFRSTEPGEMVFYLWRNASTVVVGRHQNPWIECRLADMERDGVKLARRPSGGGAVFHDLGNTNFTFATRRATYAVARQIGVVTAALARLGLHAEFSGRNDVVVDGRKVSGSAFFGRGDRWLHHGTLLIDADLSRLAHYLTVPPSKIASKGVQSVRSRVANIREFTEDAEHHTVCAALLESFAEEYGGAFSIERLDPESMGTDGLDALVERYRDDAWRFGRTPQFTHHLEHRFTWGGIDLHLDVHKGVVTDVEIFSDALSVDLVDALREALDGVRYRRDDLSARIVARAGAHAEYGVLARDVATWLSQTLNTTGS